MADHGRDMISTTAELEELVDNTVSIPTIPAVLNEINQVFHSPDGSAKDAAKVIERDPAIAAKVLRLVNSSFYGLKHPVSAIQLACSILGLKTIRNLVVQATVLETFANVPALEGFDAAWLWDHSFKTALAARMLAERSPTGHRLGKDDAYTCGLIHDVGKMVLLESQTGQFGEALQLSRSACIPLAKAEGEVFGFTHAHVGGLLAQRWKLAEAVQAAVMYHHSPATNPEDWARSFLIKAANTVAHQCAASDGGYRPDLTDADGLQALDLSDRQWDEVRTAVRAASVAG
jgi:HD-like signal output (HDOD) protein